MAVTGVPYPPRRLLRGTCSLIFEGQSFVPESAGTEYWLEISDEMRRRFTERLLIFGWQNEF